VQNNAWHAPPLCEQICAAFTHDDCRHVSCISCYYFRSSLVPLTYCFNIATLTSAADVARFRWEYLSMCGMQISNINISFREFLLFLFCVPLNAYFYIASWLNSFVCVYFFVHNLCWGIRAPSLLRLLTRNYSLFIHFCIFFLSFIESFRTCFTRISGRQCM